MDTSQLHAHKERVNHYLAKQLTEQPLVDERLLAAMEHGLLLGGKRVRPFLVYSVGQMLGANIDELDPIAGSIEAIHAYSLIHDDLPAMDDDSLRRGRPTCHIQFDEATAILAGDALQTLAFELLTTSNYQPQQQVDMVKVLAKASGYQGMCGGQALDIAATDNDNGISLLQLEQIHRHKTGALICAAVELGAIAANAPKETRELLATFSQNIGLAFQVHDDILDIIGDTATLGKPQGSDLAANKSTYPALLGLEEAKSKAQRLIAQAIEALEQLPYDYQLLKEFSQYIIARQL
ncbi:(2E,6E)-farnesyl diphosphate synthase [Psychrobium sp. 1_MG-2023]|uniref:(2E,6E)-farnesyl diphosphate synthase n=1 Tax=Psychrobium sp. 1_MG-2023 TaxID=3062624 RepID=UPI000C33FA86|nr:(2E,6E)-farnesyl diphosphate synthase [Psychrobium sp. 1_MG-2023]MDP2560050.1 (2E,6E)-farnesyl diphosphate synthase [Psychrobium sp. 1_MG-2023]PKF56289.1 (2E,6E)-farnesyl diphosphate synthase [Alteromonadales bacterium alter-6D02]